MLTIKGKVSIKDKLCILDINFHAYFAYNSKRKSQLKGADQNECYGTDF